ncbi:flagellar hook assembly protein FlgD [Sutcliffiella horikoshii]|uniref:flagellar hook assembly protein FlgD n=1 Tax=Sutcliffiella horikoshii TaxID=79883 RepID=UPI001F35A7F8|nr:flagellar hook assembly protein FlgD [Sutcliffiella horikoshii]MCG1020653.1 flagellar hook assembly protein FlgD [Sutcliffiella horikoshii]
MTNTISSDLYIQNRPVDTSKQNNVMGKDDFLRLLIAQLQNQDPLNPMEDREFIAQMANFSSLEQMANLNKSMEGFIDTQNKMNVLSLQQYLGSNLTWQHTYFVEDEPFVEMKNGTVASISMQDGKARLVMDDGSEIAVEQITRVNQPGEHSQAGNAQLLTASHLIGKKVSFSFGGDSYEDIPVQSVLMKEGKAHLIVNDARLTEEKIPMDAITKITQ